MSNHSSLQALKGYSVVSVLFRPQVWTRQTKRWRFWLWGTFLWRTLACTPAWQETPSAFLTTQPGSPWWMVKVKEIRKVQMSVPGLHLVLTSISSSPLRPSPFTVALANLPGGLPLLPGVFHHRGPGCHGDHLQTLLGPEKERLQQSAGRAEVGQEHSSEETGDTSDSPPPQVDGLQPPSRLNFSPVFTGVSGVHVHSAVRDMSDASLPSLQCYHHHPGRSVRVRASLRSSLGTAERSVRKRCKKHMVWKTRLMWKPCSTFLREIILQCGGITTIIILLMIGLQFNNNKQTDYKTLLTIMTTNCCPALNITCIMCVCVCVLQAGAG